jgi:hypothetical protein
MTDDEFEKKFGDLKLLFTDIFCCASEDIGEPTLLLFASFQYGEKDG